jgi:hypothetical protein
MKRAKLTSTVHNIRRPAFSLILASVAAGLFFIATDPRFGVWHRGYSDNPVDGLYQGIAGTAVGLSGSVAFFAVGVFLLTRPRA